MDDRDRVSWRDVVIVAVALALTYGFMNLPFVRELSPDSVDWTWPKNCHLAHLDSERDSFLCDEDRQKN